MGSVPTTDRDLIVRFHQRLIEELITDEEVVVAMSGSPCVMGIILKEPDIRLRLSIDGASTILSPVEDENEPIDDPRIIMTWPTAYKFWQGSLDIMSAVLTGAVRVEGSDMDPLFQLKSIVHKAREASRTVADEMGWS